MCVARRLYRRPRQGQSVSSMDYFSSNVSRFRSRSVSSAEPAAQLYLSSLLVCSPSMVRRFGARLFTVILLLSSLANVAVAWRTRAHAPRVKSSTDQSAIQPPLVAGATRTRLRLKKRRSDAMAYAQPSELFWFEPPRKQSVDESSRGSTQERAGVADHRSRLSSS